MLRKQPSQTQEEPRIVQEVVSQRQVLPEQKLIFNVSEKRS